MPRFILDIDFPDDPDKDDALYQVVKKCITSAKEGLWSCYVALLDELLVGLNTNDPRYAYLNAELKYLVKAKSTTKMGKGAVRYVLNDEGNKKYTIDAALAKVAALRSVVNTYKDDENLIAQIYGKALPEFKKAIAAAMAFVENLDGLVKTENGRRTAEALSQKQAPPEPLRLKDLIIAKAPAAAKTADEILKMLIDAPMPALGAVEIIRRTGPAGLAAFLSSGDVDEDIRAAVIPIVVTETRLFCSRNPSAPPNRARPYSICEDFRWQLTKADAQEPDNNSKRQPIKPSQDIRPGTQEYYKVMNEIAAGIEFLIKQKKVAYTYAAEQFQNLLYTNDMLANLCSKLRTWFRRQVGLLEVEKAYWADFKPEMRANALVEELVQEAETLLNKAEITLSVQVDDGGIFAKQVPLRKFSCFTFYRLGDYAKMLKDKTINIVPTSKYLEAYDNLSFAVLDGQVYDLAARQGSAPVPLIQIEDGVITPYNLTPFICLTEHRAAWLYFYENFREKRVTEPGKFDWPGMPLVKNNSFPALKLRDIIVATEMAPYWQAVRRRNSDQEDVNFGFQYQYRYKPLYFCASDGMQSHLILALTSGSAGLSREDPVDEEDYCWAFAGNLQYLAAYLKNYTPKDVMKGHMLDEKAFATLTADDVGEFLGLAKACRVSGRSDLPDIELNGGESKDPPLQLTIEEGRAVTFDGTAFHNVFLTHNGAEYVLCNTPSPFGKKVVTGDALKAFRFYYFRRVENSKVLKRASGQGTFKNRPTQDDVLDDVIVKDEKGNNKVLSIGVNLPISFNIATNYAVFNKYKKELGAIKNKAGTLGKARNDRKSAAAVMAPIAQFTVPELPLNTTGAGLSASTLAEAVMQRGHQRLTLGDKYDPPDGSDPWPGRVTWQRLKQSPLETIPAAQEWCHLKGHGDNGGERVGNFVSGSKHCNTEQLAIETFQRPVTQATSAYKLKATAYLLKDRSMRVATTMTKDAVSIPTSYLTALDDDYGKYMAARRDDKDEKVRSRAEEDFVRSAVNAPVAAFMRYKLIGPDNQMRLDYVFEGQSEFIDANQFNILGYTVKYLLDPANYAKELALSFATNKK